MLGRRKKKGNMKNVSGIRGKDKAAVAGSRAVIFSHWGQTEEPRGTDYTTGLPSVSQQKSKIKASYREKYRMSPMNTKMRLITLLNIISLQEAEGREEILTEMFSDYILMTKSILR